jgi:predicted nuclease with TOPRIM domain
MSGKIEYLSERLREIKRERSELDQEKAVLWDELLGVEQELKDLLNRSGISAAKTRIGTVRLTEKLNVKVSDWQEVHDYIIAHKLPYLLHKRISTKAYEELMTLGVQIPGTEPETIYGIGLTSK